MTVASPQRVHLPSGPAGRASVVAGMLVIGGLAAPVRPLVAAGGPLAEPLLVITGSDPGVPFGAPEGITIDARHGEVLLANTGQHRIEVFDLGGYRRARFAHPVQSSDGKRADGFPTSIALDRAGDLLVADRLAGYVDVLDYRGRSIARLDLGLAGPAAQADGPGALACASDGTILVATRGDSGRVHEFAPSFTKSGEWGEPGTAPGHLSRITGLAVTPDDHVVVSCQNTDRAVQIFDRRGTYLTGFGVHEIGPGNFSFPSGLTVTKDGRIWVSDAIRHVIQVFNPNGDFLGAVGGVGKAPGEFQYPAALASDGDSLLAIAEVTGNRFQLMRIR